MEDEYLAGMGIGGIRVLNAENFAYGDLDIERSFEATGSEWFGENHSRAS
jgi:hypothetical protein